MILQYYFDDLERQEWLHLHNQATVRVRGPWTRRFRRQEVQEVTVFRRWVPDGQWGMGYPTILNEDLEAVDLLGVECCG